MGQLIAAHHIADGVYAGQVGALVGIHHDALLAVQFKAQLLRINAGKVSLAASRHQDLLTIGIFFLAVHLVHGAQQPAVLLDAQHLCAGLQDNTQLFHVLDNDLHGFLLLPRHQLGHHLHHSDVGAVSCEGTGQLQTNHAAAHDNHAAGQAGQVQRTGGINAQLMAGHRNHHGHRACSNGNKFALILLAAADNHAVLFQNCLTGDDFGSRLFQQELHAPYQLGSDLTLALLNLFKAEGACIAENILLHQTANLLHGVGLIHQILGGDAADIQAGSAQMLLFKQSHFHALFRCGNAQGITAGTAAND